MIALHASSGDEAEPLVELPLRDGPRGMSEDAPAAVNEVRLGHASEPVAVVGRATVVLDSDVLGVVAAKESPSIATEVLNINAKDDHLP